jgi:hypothetical protein
MVAFSLAIYVWMATVRWGVSLLLQILGVREK